MIPTKFFIAVAVATLAARFTSIRVIGFLPAFFAILVIEILLNLFYAVYLYPYYLSPLRTIPVPKGGHILFGHGIQEIRESEAVLAKKWDESVPHTDFIRYLGFFGEEKLIAMTPDAARQVLNNGAFEFPVQLRSIIAISMGDGLVAAEGSRHERLRKLLNPVFTPSQQRHLVPALWATTLELNKKLKEIIHYSGSPTVEVNMLEWTNRVTFDMMGVTSWGFDFKALRDPNYFYRLFDRNTPTDGFEGFEAFDGFLFYVAPLFVNDRILKLLPLRRYQAQVADSKLMLKKYREIIAQSKLRESEVSKDGNHKDLLSVMLSGGDLNDYDLMENMRTFIVAGWVTNAMFLIWAIYVLGTHPDIQVKLRTEVRSVLQAPGMPLTSAKMDAMKYLHCFVMENSRLYSPIHGSSRQAMRTTVINGVTIPKNITVIYTAFAMHRSKAVWGPDAEDFVPERWLPERRKPGVEHNGEYLTYGLGPKACIGKEYSLRAVKTVIIRLISEFEFSYEGEDPLIAWSRNAVLKPRGGLTVKIKMAEPW